MTFAMWSAVLQSDLQICGCIAISLRLFSRRLRFESKSSRVGSGPVRWFISGVFVRIFPRTCRGTDQNPMDCVWNLSALLLWFARSGAPLQWLLRQFLVWLAFAIEGKLRGAKGTSDALVAAPVPRGHKRARRLDPNLVTSIADEAGKGQMSRTGRQVVQALARMRFGKRIGMSIRAGNQTVPRLIGQYYRFCCGLFRNPVPSCISLAFDATRMNGRDTLYCALFDCETLVGCWCPPQAPSLLNQGAQCPRTIGRARRAQ